MGKTVRTLICLLLCSLLAVQAALASNALGSDILVTDTRLSCGTTLAKGVFWSSTYSDLRQEHYIAYTPNTTVLPIVSYGSKITSKSTLSTSAQAVEKNGSQVVAGVNGDYYVVSTGVPLGIVVTEGTLRTSASYLSAIGIRDDGTAFIGTPNLTLQAATGANWETSFELAGLNKVRSSEGGVYLFTEDFGSTTLNTRSGVDVILSLPADRADGLKIGKTVTATVDKVVEATGSTKLEPGKAVLSTVGTGGAWHLKTLRNMKAGDQVQLSISSTDTRWNDAEYAMGGLYRLLDNGSAVSGLPTGSAPRTAIGIKADGTTIFYTIDGRQPGYSIGATMSQVASRLLELGCVDAICLDGGGSTSLGVTMPDDAAMELINSPSDGSQRATSTCFLLVSHNQPSGILGSFYIKPYDALLLTGTSLPLNAVALDTNYCTMQYDGSISYGIHNGDGVISADGLFTAGNEGGICTVTATAGNASGSATLTVVDTPSTIRLTGASGAEVKSLSVSPNSLVDLTASATYQGLDLTVSNSCFTWSVTGGIGSVDENGRFAAGAKSASGTLTVSKNGVSCSIPVTVKGHVMSLADFESGIGGFTETNTVSVSACTDLDYVKCGKQSMKLRYQADESKSAVLPVSLPISNGETQLSLWIYGDGSGNALTATAADTNGPSTISLGSLNFTGWKRCTASLPAGVTALSGLGIQCTNASGGTLYLDQIISANEAVTDETPPQLSLSVSGTKVSGTVKDAIDGACAKSRVSLLYDGKALSFTLNEATGVLSATLPSADGKLHRLTLTAADVSGNLARTGKDLGAAATNAFADTANHWAKPYAQYLYDHGIAGGIFTVSGRTFQPDKNISRAEFAILVANGLGLNIEDYGSTVLPFADAAAIPDWAEDAVKAVYGAGILNGSMQNGILSFLPNSSISRAEVAALLSRTIARGYPIKAMTFSDVADVPAWAKNAMELLSSMGILTGYNNRISPSDPITRGAVAKLLVSIR